MGTTSERKGGNHAVDATMDGADNALGQREDEMERRRALHSINFQAL